MSQLIHQHPEKVDADGVSYVARVYGEERPDGSWKGWLEFRSTDKRGPVLRTGQETSQPSRATIEYWALGLEPVYLDGALARAQGRLP